MCTSIAFIRDGLYFGRNMDLDCGFGQQVVIMPRAFPYATKQEGTLDSHYAMIGMAAVVEDIPLYADAVNEFGLCGAGLNFPESSCYSNILCRSRHNITPYELIPWVLGKCADLSEARELLKNTSIYAEPFSEDVPLTPLHWHFADKTGSLVLEAMRDGIHIYDDPANVLTNEPPLDFHITNLCHYLNLTPGNPENSLTSITGGTLFGKGLGSFGLPGDYSPSSRFVRVAYLMENSPASDRAADNIAQVTAVLDSAAVVKGSVRPDRRSDYCTIYSGCIDAERRTYYYKTYNNSQLTGVRLLNEDIDSSELYRFYPEMNQQVRWEN